MATMHRFELLADAVYYIHADDMYFYTPDGEGGVFYDDEDALIEAHGNEYNYIDIDELSDF